VLVDWLSYGRTMPACDVVVAHGGHGTLVRALTLGCVVVVCPAAGDQNENAARVDWAGVGVRLPRRLLGPRSMRLAVRRALSEPRLREGAGRIATWHRDHDGPATAALAVEEWAAAPR
jgi:UDP:flavonoid glycosyltransferase YjiC (YdhE family)